MTRVRDRGRLAIVICAIIALGFLFAYVWATHGDPDIDRRRQILLVWAIVAVGAKLIVGIIQIPRFLRGKSGRPGRLDLNNGAFDVPPMRSAALAAGSNILVISVIIGLILEGWWPAGGRPSVGGSIAWFLAIALLLALAVYLAAGAWRGTGLSLTPAGLIIRTPLSRREVPWTALKRSTPKRVPLRAPLLSLSVEDPSQVTTTGPVLGAGRVIRLPMDFYVHPWFLADTIRWYVDHPVDRNNIGNPAELNRLLDTLTVTK